MSKLSLLLFINNRFFFLNSGNKNTSPKDKATTDFFAKKKLIKWQQKSKIKSLN